MPSDFISIDSFGGFHGNPECQYIHLAVDHLTRFVWKHVSNTNQAVDIFALIKEIQFQGGCMRIGSSQLL